MICVSLAHMDFNSCMQLAEKEPFVEFRFDLLDVGPDRVTRMVSAAKRCIATCRPGNLSGGKRLLILRTALEAGADYVDIELESDKSFRKELMSLARSRGSDVILSHHDFEKTPGTEELDRIVRDCRNAGADLVKVACRVNHREDLLNLLQLYRHKFRMIVIGMGEEGLISRVAAPFLGAEFTFASAGEGRETAPGQISREKLESLIEQLK